MKFISFLILFSIPFIASSQVTVGSNKVEMNQEAFLLSGKTESESIAANFLLRGLPKKGSSRINMGSQVVSIIYDETTDTYRMDGKFYSFSGLKKALKPILVAFLKTEDQRKPTQSD